MVVLDKTYNGARGIVQRIVSVVMIFVGFILLLLLPSSKHLNPFNQAMGGDGVAHADAAPNCGFNCNSCTECASLESSSGDCAGDGDGGGGDQ